MLIALTHAQSCQIAHPPVMADKIHYSFSEPDNLQDQIHHDASSPILTL